MTQRAIVDAGPLVAMLSARDHHHAWAKSAFAGVTPPAVTCEAVVAEAWHLLRDTANGQIALLDLLAAGTLTVEFALLAELLRCDVWWRALAIALCLSPMPVWYALRNCLTGPGFSQLTKIFLYIASTAAKPSLSFLPSAEVVSE